VSAVFFGVKVRRASHVRQRLAALSLLGAALLTYPLLSLPNGYLAGIPATYFYLFAVWAVLIGLAAWVAERQGN
jgi:hypothetical protein